MSNLLTETRNYQNMLEKRRKINEIKENELNKECFDCGSCYPEYISINNGVFICNNCIKIHNKFPKEISLTLKNNLSSLNNKELEFMYLGGNQNLINFIHNYFPELNQFSKDIFYQTKAMQYYRDYLNYLVNSGPEPVLPSKNINAYELVDSNNDLKKKKYERINLGTNYKGVYKNKKRNKSVGNKKGINNNNNKSINSINRINNDNDQISKDSRNKSFRKNHFLNDDDKEEELKRHKSFYKEMNKLFKDEDDINTKTFRYIRKKSTSKFKSNNINKNNKYVKYSSKTNEHKNNYKEYPIENIYNNNYFNLTTTKNIFMFTPMKEDIIYNYRQINKNNKIKQIDKLSLTNVKDIYSKPKITHLNNSNQNNENENDDLILSLRGNMNINKLDMTNINSYRNKDAPLTSNNNFFYNNNYLSTNTYNRKSNQNKFKETFANININNMKNTNFMRNTRKNDIKKENLRTEFEEINNRNDYTFRENNKDILKIKEIKIEKIGRKRSNDFNNDKNHEINNNLSNNKETYNYPKEQHYKKLNVWKLNINNNSLDNNIKKENEKYIKNININFDKIKDRTKIKNNKPNYKSDTFGDYKSKEEIGYSTIQKYSIRNKYKMRKNQENI